MDKPLITRRTWLHWQLGALPAAFLGRVAEAADETIVVPIVGPRTRITDISLGVLERAFLGHPIEGPDGVRLVPFNHPPKTRSRVLFDHVVLRMSPDEVARHWVDQRIRGNRRAPRSVSSVELLKQVVAQLPGAVSYVPIRDLDDSVRALRVGGTRHDSPKYPLKG